MELIIFNLFCSSKFILENLDMNNPIGITFKGTRCLGSDELVYKKRL